MARRWRQGCGGLLLAAVAGCTATTPTSTATSGYATTPPAPAAAGPVLAWSRVDLSSGLEPKTLTTMGDRLLVGALKAPAASGDEPSPAMLTMDGTGAQTAVPLTPQSPYAFFARWYSVVTDGTRIVAIGGANGGAHANVRWTTWSGTAAGVTELPQSFYAFGGWGAGELVDAVMTPGGDALVGSWGGAQAGLDAAVWTFADPVWTRQDPAGTALESTAKVLVGPRGATSDGPGILVTGSALHLDAGSVGQTAALWRSAGVNRDWHRIDLPDVGQHSESVSARCASGAGGSCLVAGQVDGALAVWSLAGDQPVRDRGVPTVPVGDKDVVPAPILPAGTGTSTGTSTATGALLVVPDGTHTSVVSRGAATSPWATSAGPSGLPVAAALVGQRLYVATRPSAGASATLWQARWGG